MPAARAPAPPGAGAPAHVELREVTLAYGASVVLERVDLDVSPGELVAVIGPSGSGKSSVLRCLAGFLPPLGGAVVFDGEVVAEPGRSVPPERRRIGFVFQSFALWPHMSVRDNVAYPWKVRRVPRPERERAADEALSAVGLSGLGDRSPFSLSGGQQQRVALARALAGSPRLLLLDEPLSSVDAALRDELQSLVLELVGERALTTLITTHDQQEAMTLADRIVVLGGGGVAQCGTPVELYENPANGFVARFMGALNVFDVTVLSPAGAPAVVSAGAGAPPVALPGVPSPAARRAVLVVRPEHVAIGLPPPAREEGAAMSGVVLRSTQRAGQTEVRVRAGGLELRGFEAGHPHRRPGEEVGVTLTDCRLLDEEPEGSGASG